MAATTASQAPVYGLDGDARLADDLAAPHEAALAVLSHRHLLLAVAPVAAEQVTAAHAHGVWVTLAAHRAQRPHLALAVAEVGRVLRVDEVVAGRRLDGVPLRQQPLAVVGDDDLGGAVELLLEQVAHVSERGHLHPARLERAGAGQPVTLALLPHVVLDGLHSGDKAGGQSWGWEFIKGVLYCITHTHTQGEGRDQGDDQAEDG